MTYDLLVVGGGTAGLVGARTAASFGARVLLVERHRFGGDCLWTGCVPSKSMLAAAEAAAGARAAGRFGVDVDGVRVDFARVRAHVHGARDAIAPVDSPEALRAAGVEVRHGDATLTGPRTAEVDGEPVRFRAALLATGSGPAVPDLPGLRAAAPLTSDDVWDRLEELPRRLAVLGGGSIGCELGQAFARLGAQVVLVEGAERLLGREDPRAAERVRRALVDEGVEVRLGVPVASVEADGGGGGALHLEDGSTVPYDALLVAVGRSPRTDGLGLEAAGVQRTERGHVQVDAQLRTTAPGVWAAGDVTGLPQFTHTAGVHASTAASNAVLGLRRTADLRQPRVTYTTPEVGAVGVQAHEAEPSHRVLTWEHAHVDRAIAEAQTDGWTTLVVDRRGRVVGGTVVGPRAGETLGELTLARVQGLRTRDLAATTHAYPTWSDGLWNAAIEDVRAQLRAPVPRLLTRAVVRGRRLYRRAR